MQGYEVEHTLCKQFVSARLEVLDQDGDGHVGELQAWYLDAFVQVWQPDLRGAQRAAEPVTTAGGLVFMGGTSHRYFRAFDAESRHRTSGASGPTPASSVYRRPSRSTAAR